MRSLVRDSVNKMAGYIPGEQMPRKDIIKLNTNENPYPPSPAVVGAVAEIDPTDLRLYPDPGWSDFVGKITELHACDTSMVFVGNGLDEVLALCTRAFVENTGSIGYFEPSYSLYPVLADIREVAKKPVELGENFEWNMPLGYDSSLFFLTTPNAPTGIMYSRDTIRQFCKEFPGVVVLDEAYVDFASDNYMDFAKEFDNVLVLRSLSKSFSLAGLRVGYAVGSSILIDALIRIKDSYNLNSLSQRIALAAITDIDYMRGNVRKIKATRARLAGELSKFGYDVIPSEANFLLVRPQGISAGDLFSGLKKQGVLIRYFPGKMTGEFVRITIGTDDEIDRLLECVELLS